jgi:hypothetical protein
VSACAGDTPTPPCSILLAALVLISALVISLAAVMTVSETTPGRRRMAAEVSTVVVAGLALVSVRDMSSAWIVLLLVGTGVAVEAVLPDRRYLKWVAVVPLTLSSWVRLQMAEVSLVEAYTLPPAAALLLIGAVSWYRQQRSDPWRVWGPGVAVAAVPSVIASVGGGVGRPWALLAVAAVLVVASLAVQTLREMRVPAVAGAVIALGVGLGRPANALVHGELAGDRVELWSWTAAMIVFVAATVIRLPRLGSRAGRSVAIAGGAVLVWLPTVLAIMVPLDDRFPGDGTQLWRGAIVLGLGLIVAAIDLAASWSGAAQRLRSRMVDARVPVQVAVAVSLTVLVEVVHDSSVPERWTVPAALIALVFGTAVLRRSDRAGSWPALGPGVVLLLLPSLLMAPEHGGTVRIVALVAVATAVVVIGAVLRLQAPLAIGGVVLAVHGVIQLGPDIAALAGTVPRWVVLSLAGIALLILGITYERRIAEARALRLRFRQLR